MFGFDSGSSHAAVLEQHDELAWPADLYLKGVTNIEVGSSHLCSLLATKVNGALQGSPDPWFCS